MEDQAVDILTLFKSVPNQLSLILSLLFICVFTILVALDVKNAYKIRASWIPGKSLVLSALSIQVLLFVNHLKVGLSEDNDRAHLEELLDHQLLLDGSRLFILVFIGYLLPGMVGPGSGVQLSTIVALVISLFSKVSSEIFYINQSKHVFRAYWKDKVHRSYRFWFIVSNVIVLISIIFLILLLVCTVVVGKTVREVMKQRISAILYIDEGEDFGSSTESYEDKNRLPYSWDNFEAQIFKSWLLARACRPDYVIARSVLSSAAGMVVTTSVVLSVLKIARLEYHKYHLIRSYHGWVQISELFLLFGFVLVGWIIICWRWFAALLYFPRHRGAQFGIENFWTNSIVELIFIFKLAEQRSEDNKRWRRRDRQSKRNERSRKRDRQSKHNERSRRRDRQSKNNKSSRRDRQSRDNSKCQQISILYFLWPVQISVVLLSKGCWYLSDILLGKFMRWCQKQIKGKEVNRGSPDYKEYSQILERICMPGEDPSNLWKANESSINEIVKKMRKGRDKGRGYHIIKSLGLSSQSVDAGFQLLDELRKEALPQVHKYFPSIENRCWKMTALSLMVIMIKLDNAKSDRVKRAMKACRKTWDLLSFVEDDGIDLEADKLNLIDSLETETDHVSMTADKEFCLLRDKYEKLPNPPQESVETKSPTEVKNELLKDAEDRLRTHGLLEAPNGNNNVGVDSELGDSKDWMEIAQSYNMYKILLAVKDEDLAYWTEKSFSNIIGCCLSRVPDMLVKYSHQWAEEWKEDKLWEAVYLAGKARGMMESGTLQISRQNRSEMELEWTLQARPL